MGRLGQSKHPPHSGICNYCNGEILWFWRGQWLNLDPVTGQRHRCKEYFEQAERRHGPVRSRAATNEELSRLRPS